MTSRRHRPLREARPVKIKHDGEIIDAFEGEPLAAALMAADVRVLSRSAKYHRPRGAACGSGDCANCLVTVDGLPNRSACMTPCRDGMVSESQNVLGSAENDLLGITDWMFPWGLDHHEMFTGVPLVQPVVQRVVRKLSGLGVLKERGTTQGDSTSVRSGPITVDVLVVGAGTSGMAAAEAAALGGASVLVVEARSITGGRLSSGVHRDPEETFARRREAEQRGVSIWTESTAVQIDRHDHPLEVLVLRASGLAQVIPRVVVMAPGGYGATGIFENNDLPGVVAAEWAGRLLSKWGVLVGERPLICADNPAAETLSRLFTEAGAPPARVVPLSAAFALASMDPPPIRLVSAKGTRHVERAVIETDDGRETIPCDVIVIAAPPAPAFELALDAGCKVAYEPTSGGFAVASDADGRTAAPDILACGTVTGPCSVEQAFERGSRAGRMAAEVALLPENRQSPAPESRHAS